MIPQSSEQFLDLSQSLLPNENVQTKGDQISHSINSIIVPRACSPVTHSIVTLSLNLFPPPSYYTQTTVCV